MTELDKLKLRLGVSTTDAALDAELALDLEDAESAILDYCNRSELPESAAALKRDLAISIYRRKGQEAEASRSEGAISVSYASVDNIPAEIKQRLNRYRLLSAARFVKDAETEGTL